MYPKALRVAYLYFIFVSLASNVSATVLYQDLNLVPALAKAHGLVMSIAFVVAFPLGALLIQVLKSKRRVWIHISLQLVGWVLMLTGLATGIRVGKILDRLHSNAHTVLGTVIVVLLLFQPFIGFIHHRRFLATKKRSAWTYAHIWYGRILMLLGIVNGGLGLRLAGNTLVGTITYGAIAGLVSILYCAVLVVSELKRASQRGNATSDIALESSNSQTH
ncbi:integral membrane protein [Leptodontidium sp. MPI-SDFR-AT-0119]|nr:integral membrane protein [Leptodontidium sp. MPI-SDFR-AT-0119]